MKQGREALLISNKSINLVKTIIMAVKKTKSVAKAKSKSASCGKGPGVPKCSKPGKSKRLAKQSQRKAKKSARVGARKVKKANRQADRYKKKKEKEIIKKKKTTTRTENKEKKKNPPVTAANFTRASFGSSNTTKRNQESSGRLRSSNRRTSEAEKRDNPSQIKGARAKNISENSTAKAKAQPNRNVSTKASGLNTRVAPPKPPTRKPRK